MKVRNKLLRVTLALLLVMFLPFNLQAEIQTGSCGENVTYRLDTETGLLRIEGSGEMTSFPTNYILSGSRKYVKRVEIGQGVTSIAKNAFGYCSSLISIVIPNSVTSIESGAFHDCTSLTTINLPEGMTSIEGSTFGGCSSLVSINIPGNVSKIGMYAFSDCKSLSSIEIPNKVTIIDQGAFRDCM